MDFQLVQFLAGWPFLYTVGFSTTFSPGSGIIGVKGLRYLFPRFYLWCLLPGVQVLMEGCPAVDDDHQGIVWYMVLTSIVAVTIFLVGQVVALVVRMWKRQQRQLKEQKEETDCSINDMGLDLEAVLYGQSKSDDKHESNGGIQI